MTEPAQTCCIVDAQGDKIIVWQVHTGSNTGFSRITGAWVIDTIEKPKIDLLVAQRLVLATFIGEGTLKRLGTPIRAYIDPEATIKNLELVCNELQAAYDAHPKRQNLVAPEWPAMPGPIDMRYPPTVPAEEPKQVALAVARWLAEAATTWTHIESERLPRKYMPGGPNRQSMPIAIRKENQ